MNNITHSDCATNFIQNNVLNHILVQNKCISSEEEIKLTDNTVVNDTQEKRSKPLCGSKETAKLNTVLHIKVLSVSYRDDSPPSVKC